MFIFIKHANIPYLYPHIRSINYLPNIDIYKYPNLVDLYIKPYPTMQLLPIIMTPEIYLMTSIAIETFSTICLKMVLKNKIWYFPAYTGYAISFYLFPKSLTKYPLSVAYTIWCGFGIIFTLFADKFIFKEVLKIKNIIGSVIVIFGIFITKY